LDLVNVLAIYPQERHSCARAKADKQTMHRLCICAVHGNDLLSQDERFTFVSFCLRHNWEREFLPWSFSLTTSLRGWRFESEQTTRSTMQGFL